MPKTKSRIIGYDFARGLAIIGMVLVNFKMVLAIKSDSILYQLVSMISGKAAALFVVLAGVGISLMHQNAVRKNSAAKIRQVKSTLLKRALFLFIIGLSYCAIWPADILHFYGIYLSMGVLFLSVSSRWLQLISFFIAILYPIVFLFIDYETGWDWKNLEYLDFFSFPGFFRNLFLNGFHPVWPWISFLMTGIWLGRINFSIPSVRKRISIWSFSIFIGCKSISLLLIYILNQQFPPASIEISTLLSTSPMPSLFFYMITAGSLAVFIISTSIYVCNKYASNLGIQLIASAGQLALTNYIFHVLIGMLLIEVFFGKLEQAFSMQFTFIYACIYLTITLFCSYCWKKKYSHGPLEHIMRKITS